VDRVRPARALASGVAVALLAWGLATPAWSDPTPPPAAGSPAPTTASPAPDLSSSPAPTTPAPAPTSPTAPQPTPTPSSPTSPPTTSSAAPRPRAQAAEPAPAAPLTLAVASQGGPVAGAFYEDLGSFAFSGTSTLADGSTVTVQRRTSATWAPVATARVTTGAYAASWKVEAAGAAAFRAVADGAEGAVVSSPTVTVTVHDSTVSVKPVAEVDSLKAARVRGTVVPARAGVTVVVDVRVGSRWPQTAPGRPPRPTARAASRATPCAPPSAP
jgi:hypothetical protein